MTLRQHALRLVNALFLVAGIVIAIYRDRWIGMWTAAFFGSALSLDLAIERFERHPLRGRRNPARWRQDLPADHRWTSVRDLAKVDVVGKKLLAIAQHHSWEIGGVDTSRVFFVIDVDLAFELPSYGETWRSSLVPPGAKLVLGSDVDPVIGSTVADILRPADEPDYMADDVFLLLDTGWMMSICSAAPHGTGGAGLSFHAPETTAVAALVSIWTETPKGVA